jgi:hypothetical protein
MYDEVAILSDKNHYISFRLSSEPLQQGREALSQPSIICSGVKDFFLYSITFGQMARNWSAEKETVF